MIPLMKECQMIWLYRIIQDNRIQGILNLLILLQLVRLSVMLLVQINSLKALQAKSLECIVQLIVHILKVL